MNPTTRIVALTGNNYLLNALRKVVKELAVADLAVVRSSADCLESLALDDDALLIVDWTVGVKTVHEVLASLQNPIKILIRPILLVAPAPEPQIASLAIEFAVARVLSGEVSLNTLKTSLQAIWRRSELDGELQRQLAQVAALRLDGKWPEARRLLDELTNLYPDDLRVVASLAENYLFEDRAEDALALVSKHAAAGANDVRLHNLMGRALFRLGRLADAAKAYGQAKLMNPYHMDRLLALGEILMECGEFEGAKENFLAALSLDDSSRAARQGVGRALLVTGEINEALAMLKETVGSTECAAIFNAAGVLCVRHQRIDDGIKLYEYAVRSLTVHRALLAKMAFNLGLAHFRKRSLHQAGYYFQLALSLDRTYTKAARNAKTLERFHTRLPEIDAEADVLTLFFPKGLAKLDLAKEAERAAEIHLVGEEAC